MLSGNDESGPLRMFINDGSFVHDSAKRLQADVELTKNLQKLIIKYNPLMQEFKRLADQPSENARLELTVNNANDLGAIIIPSRSGEIQKQTVVCWRVRENEPTFIESSNPLYVPLHYVLLCPTGTFGWSRELEKTSKGTTMLMYNRQIILRSKVLHLLGGLMNEYVVDIFSGIEDERLNWIRFNQQKICKRTDLENGEQTGRVFLPASFIGSYRHNQKLISDALAIVSRFGNPTYFITITCNPAWPEIKAQLNPGQNGSDRPDIVCMVFKAKLQKFLENLPRYLNGGHKVYQIFVIEFQSRGLPHSHIVVKMAHEPSTAAEIDAVICAELPEELTLREKVLKHMIHQHYDNRCYRSDYEKLHQHCHYDYPKRINVETYTNEAGYPVYRRRSECDRNVVPYNPLMIDEFDCHINIELASSVILIMYLYKYLYKGNDFVKGSITTDEAKTHIAGRYLSASEGTWRIFSYDITRRDPAVSAYPVHLENQNYVVFDGLKSSSRDTALDTISKLERYFARPIDPDFDPLKYIEYYESYIIFTGSNMKQKSTQKDTWYDTIVPPKTGHVQKRKKIHVGRIQIKKLQAGEVWYLRLLLQHRPARSFEEIRTVDNVLHASYSEAARATGLLENVTESEICMQEAKDFLCSPRQLRFLFVVLITEGAGTTHLYEIFKNFMFQDFKLELLLQDHEAENRLLDDLALRLESYSRTLSDFNLPLPQNDSSETDKEKSRHDVRKNHASYVQHLPNLNQEKREFFEIIRARIESNTGGAFYLDGAPGRGKTFLLNFIVSYTRGNGRIALCCASSGFVAIMYPGGRTAHNLFRIPVKEDLYDLTKTECDIPVTSQRACLLRKATVVVWDEITMTHKHNLQAVNKILQKIRNNDELFGGLVFIGAGDFRQIPPIVERGTREDTVKASVKFLDIWQQFNVHKLILPVRQQQDPEFSLLVDAIANGTLPENEEGKVTLNIIQTTTDINKWLEFTYPDLIQGTASTDDGILLSVLNKQVDYLNDHISNHLKTPFVSLFSHDELDDSSESSSFFKNNVTVEFFNQLNFPNIPSHELKLKTGMDCFIVRNLSPDEGLLNNTQIVIMNITRNLIQVNLTGTKKIFYIPRISFSMNLRSKGLRMTRKQFPLRAGYVKTINRAQGATLNRAGIDLRTECFGHGQLAVAISRVRTRYDILILTTEEKLDVNRRAITTNIVYNELLL